MAPGDYVALFRKTVRASTERRHMGPSLLATGSLITGADVGVLLRSRTPELWQGSLCSW